ncbi:AraC-like ligand binding domain-containing protein [Verrucomicrobium sp. GAS474]|uniref:AraC family transcriptional regulator n=1 Tax=Verrucomicrobium sp. GAS474 TaxID=1882831 RepID=UPI00087D5D03|nr:AraC family transcriptional regulator [Verrucomicrobium sp. GAS474]SDT94495.1 AraC-like ligand binding domain-containing protein [Verrucomicrobium sp. GAS474]
MKQKRSLPLQIEFFPIPLEAREPIHLHARDELSDRPITFLHFHRCLELGFCHSGHGIFMISDKVRTFEAGDAVVIAPGEPHLARSAPGTRSRWSWIYLDPARLAAPGSVDPLWLDTAAFHGPDFPDVFSALRHPELACAVDRLVTELSSRSPGRSVLLRALVLEILVRAGRLGSHSRGGGKRGLGLPPDYARLAPALQKMACDYAEPLRMSALAKRCGLSEPQFRRVFRAGMGCSPLAYLHDLRVRMAAALLRGTTQSVLEISLETGFESVSSLHRAFRARLGTSPRVWRRKTDER